MTDHSTDGIRDLLARAMSDAPEPHAWAEVEQRSRQHDARRAAEERHRLPLGPWRAVAAAAAVVFLVAAVVAVRDRRDTLITTDVPTSTTPSTTVRAPTTTALGAEVGWTGGLLDDIDVGSLRGFDSFTEGDVIVPTAPSGWRVADSAWTGPDDAVAPDFVEWSVEVIEARPIQELGHVLYLTQSREPTCTTSLGCKPSGESVTINGVVWESIVVERIPEDDGQFVDATTLRARVGDRWVSLAEGAPQALTGPLLDNPPIIEFLEGLRVGSPESLAAIGEACWQCGLSGAEGDPFAATESSAAPRTTMPDGGPTETSEPPAQAPSDIDAGTGRPLTDLAEGDVVVPTYLPPGRALEGAAQIYEHPDGSEFSFTLGTAGDGTPNTFVRVWENGPIAPAVLEDPNHPHVDIAGITWEWNDFESARIAHIGSFSVWVYLHGLDKLEAERFIEGLRAVPIEQFPGPIASDGTDGLSVTGLDGMADAEIVASDDQFELAAVQVGNQVCTKLVDTTGPDDKFPADCWEAARLTELGIVDLYPLDSTDTKQLIIGVVDSPNVTAVRITSPEGESVVVPTGPVNQAIDGRFFLARLDLDASNGIRLDRFTIEDASQ